MSERPKREAVEAVASKADGRSKFAPGSSNISSSSEGCAAAAEEADRRLRNELGS